MKIAVLDLGTNTFHLLIANIAQGQYEILSRTRQYVYLAQDGIGNISEDAISRAEQAAHFFSRILKDEQVNQCRITSTAALRTATNGADLGQRISKILGWPVEIISGDREAELIYKGTALIHPFSTEHTSLIMDIGGGSVEFILVKNSKISWAQSFPIGIAVLKKHFHANDVISNPEILELRTFIKSALVDLDEQINQHQPVELIGASGTFDVIQAQLGGDRANNLIESFPFSSFDNIYKTLGKSSTAERINNFQIPKTRAELIVVALELIHHIRQYPSLETLSVSAYALKEGLLAEMLESNNNAQNTKTN